MLQFFTIKRHEGLVIIIRNADRGQIGMRWQWTGNYKAGQESVFLHALNETY